MSKKSINYRGYKISYEHYLSEKGFAARGNFFMNDDEYNYYTEHYFSTPESAENAILALLKSQLNQMTCKIIL